MADRFPPGTVGAARDFLAAHTGLPREKAAHYAALVSDGEELTAIVTCCDDVDEAAVMLRTALAALGSDAPVTPESRSVIVSREDLRAVLHVPTGSLPAAVLADEVRRLARQHVRETGHPVEITTTLSSVYKPEPPGEGEATCPV